MCIQRKANKMVPDEQAFITANIASFGDDIGKTTNRITSMFEVQSHFEKGSKEYDILDYRINSGQLYQQNCIDKAKGIVSKPMPREWFDYHSASKIEDEAERELYLSLLAEKKVYFQRYIYPSLMKDYNTFIANSNKKAFRTFGMSVEELMAKDELSEEEVDFIKYYYRKLPVGIGDCVMNKICRRFEEEFDGFFTKNPPEGDFNYEVMKSGAEYTKKQYDAVNKIYKKYIADITEFAKRGKEDRISDEESAFGRQIMMDEFRQACLSFCSNAEQLCDILLDICYSKESSKQFVWDVAGSTIVSNLLRKNDYIVAYPIQDDRGSITYAGKNFAMMHQRIGGWV